MVFAGVYPFNQSETKELKAALERLTLNDRSVSVNMESSLALGQGWRLGFLGILHMEARGTVLRDRRVMDVFRCSPRDWSRSSMPR